MSDDFAGLRRDHAAEARRFSIGRACVHLGITFAVLFGACMLAVCTGQVGNPRQFGEGIGQLSFMLGGLVFGLSWVFQTKSRKVAALATGGAVLLVFLLGIAAQSQLAARNPRLSSDERRPLEISSATGERRARHPFLGFSLRLPEGLEPVPADKLTDKNPAIATSAWRDDAAGRALFVFVTSAATRAELQSLLDGMRARDPALSRTLGGGPVQVVRDETTWEGEQREAHRHVTVGESHIHTDAFVARYQGGRTLSIVIHTMSRGDDQLGELAASFKPHL